MNLVIDEKHFPLWLVPQTQVSDERLQRLRDANKMFQIEREQSGELYIKPIVAPLRKTNHAAAHTRPPSIAPPPSPASIR
jgi:hypothetical protein